MGIVENKRPVEHRQRGGPPRYIVRWLTRGNEMREETARGTAEVGALLIEIENDEGDLMVAVAILSYDLI